MVRKRWGRVVNITSLIKEVGNRGQSNYAAAKGGLSGFTLAMARELGSRNITVNEVSPGLVQTDATQKLDEMKGAVEWFLERQSIKRKGEPEDIAAVVSLLVSDEASFITGACIPVNGGF
jgi:3-oxoacyl-[acyl-carrier protein] reductase